MRFTLIYLLTMLSVLIIACSKTDDQNDLKDTESASGNSLKPYGVLIGREFGPDNFPENFKEQTGYVLGLMEAEEYIINHVSDDANQLLWFCKLTHRDESGRPHLKILDIVVLPQFGHDERLFMGNCLYDGVEEPEIVALVISDPENLTTRVIKAWRANRKSLAIEEIPVDGVTCVDDSYYL